MKYIQNKENPYQFYIYFTDEFYILVDTEQFEKIINNKFNNSWKYDINIDEYPFYHYNKQNINMIQFLFGFKISNMYIEFKDNNKFNLTNDNIIIYHQYHQIIKEKYNIKEYIQGHYKIDGKDAYIIKNPIWITEDNIYLMYCEKDTITQLCHTSYQKIKEYENENEIKVTFFKLENNYINSNIKLYIHQIITGCYGNGKGTKNISVDHIDRNLLNNQFNNLRVVTQNTQINNANGVIQGTKRERKKSAQKLPNGLKHNMLPKYVTYNQECYNKQKQLYREYFRIEKHPKLNKTWSSSKSTKVTIDEKLKQAILYLKYLEEGFPEEEDKLKLPLYFHLKYPTDKNKNIYLIFDKKDDGVRYNMRQKYNPETEITQNFINKEVELVRQKLIIKYGNLKFE